MPVKRQFSNLLQRFFRGGTCLSKLEYQILCAAVGALPPHLRPIIEQQLNSYNLVQREHDDRALNFYHRSLHGKAGPLLQLETKAGWGNQVHPLIKIEFTLGSESGTFYAVLDAVNGRVFSLNFSAPMKNRPVEKFAVRNITDSWRSNFPSSSGQ